MFSGIARAVRGIYTEPSFEAPLLKSLILKRGVGNPTITRSDTADYSATVTDFGGLIKPVKNGEARFEGARRVGNLIPTPSNSLTAGNNKTVTVEAGDYVFSMGAGASGGIATINGTSGSGAVVLQSTTKRVSVTLPKLIAGTVIITASVATLVDLQLENVTGQANVNPSEYVSVGVLSAPYHGAGVDGVKYFTTQNGNTVATVQGASILRGPTDATWNGADNAYYAYPPNVDNTAEETLANIQTNKLGFVYQWSAAMAGSTTEGAQGICPAGWHVPTDAEQNTLDQYLKDNGQTCDANRDGVWDCSTAGTKLKSGGSSGLNIPLAGLRKSDGSFASRPSYGDTWSSSASGDYAWYRYLNSGLPTVYRTVKPKPYGFSVRCLKDSTNADPATTITDVDGNTYGVVTVGTQTWLDANLMVSHYSQSVVTEAVGTAIPDATLHGYLAEKTRSNKVLNSATLVTQDVTVTAVPWTLSFYGTGSVALSGTYTGNLAGTGASNRVSLTFTPTAGTLTLTVTGSVTSAQLEAGVSASSYMPTVASAVTRGTDGLSYPTSGNTGEGALSIYMEGTRKYAASNSIGNTFMMIGNYYTNATIMFGYGNVINDTHFGITTKFGNGSWTGGVTASSDFLSNIQHKIAVTLQPDLITNKVFIDGILKHTLISISAKTANWSGGVMYLGGIPAFDQAVTIRNVKIWKIAKSDTFLKAMTT